MICQINSLSMSTAVTSSTKAGTLSVIQPQDDSITSTAKITKKTTSHNTSTMTNVTYEDEKHTIPTITFHSIPNQGDFPFTGNETFQFFFNPSSINALLVDSNITVNFNCTSNIIPHQYIHDNTSNNTYHVSNPSPSTRLLVTITSSNADIAALVSYNEEKKDILDTSDISPHLKGQIFMHINLNEEHNFTIHALRLGYVTMSVSLLNTNNEEMAKVGAYKTLAQGEVPLTIIRVPKPADFVFDCSAAAIAILISFGIGCVTDTESLKRQMKYPVSLVIGFCCQFLLMPVLAFGIAMLLPLEENICFGLLCVACVPGGTAPLWIFVLGQYFQQTSEANSKIIPIYNFEIWLASTFFAYTAGLVINRFIPGVADALLTWIIKPMLLLATILYITLGVYINMYVFDKIVENAVLAAILLPLCGFFVAYALAKIFRQNSKFCTSVALETSSLNCLIVLAAIRFTLEKKDADPASTIPIWVMFTIPGMYVLLAILKCIKKNINGFLESRKQQKFRHFSIASGIVNQANMAALSAPLFVTEVTEDDQASVSEKITVL
ncbi:hypothetical protein KUTeg_016068 [Tegillarca granosa]|uniref:Ileal sodium/bile acid cotransporter n=1 Tax=Tegillarca granosa TaxID=220873 RepID=A0ABQ9EJS3_TEGGR|nr:hypothetical protein KUTeg_016068 [Tegillarca granosa]